MVYKNKNFTERSYGCTNIVACVADKPPNDNFVKAEEGILQNLTHIYTENGVQYWGWL